MTTYRATIITSFADKGEGKGVLFCRIPSSDFKISPADSGRSDIVVPVIYTSPYSFHGDGGFIAIPPNNTPILVEKIGRSYYYLTSIVGPSSEELEELTNDTSEDVLNRFGCERSYEKVYSDNMQGFPDTVMIRHPKGHIFQMKDDVSLHTGGSPKPAVHNSKIEMKSAKGKLVTLDDSNGIDAVRMGTGNNGIDKNEFDGITIGHSDGIIGPRCIKTRTKNNITTQTDNGSILNKVVEGNNFEVENTSVNVAGNTLSPTGPNIGNINLGTTFGDVNLTAGNNHALADPVKALLGSSKVIIEALGLTPNVGSLAPVVRISSDGNIEIISNPPNGTINIKSMGDINIESTAGNVNIKGLTVNLNDPAHVPFVYQPTSGPPGTSLRGYVPFGWILPSSPSI